LEHVRGGFVVDFQWKIRNAIMEGVSCSWNALGVFTWEWSCN